MEVSPEDLQELIQRPGPRAFRLIDVRSEDEFVVSRLDWAELIPLSRLPAEAPRRLVDKDRPVVVYCRDGATSQQALDQLEALGYEHVYHLAGGLEAWAKQVDAKFPLQNNSAPPTPSRESHSPVSHSPKPRTQEAPARRSSSPSSKNEVSPEELRTLMDRPGPREFRLIDVREEDEFQICKLDWAELIPLSRLSEQAPSRLVDKDKPLVVYCHHGMRSQHAAEWLRALGYQHVFNLTGGIDAWADLVDPTMKRY